MARSTIARDHVTIGPSEHYRNINPMNPSDGPRRSEICSTVATAPVRRRKAHRSALVKNDFIADGLSLLFWSETDLDKGEIYARLVEHYEKELGYVHR